MNFSFYMHTNFPVFITIFSSDLFVIILLAVEFSHKRNLTICWNYPIVFRRKVLFNL